MFYPKHLDTSTAPADTSEQIEQIQREEVRIGRRSGDRWPDMRCGTTDEYIALLMGVRAGSGVAGVVATIFTETYATQVVRYTAAGEIAPYSPAGSTGLR